MTSVLDLIGETPLVEVTQFDRGPCRLFLKLESVNPSGRSPRASAAWRA
jgi:cystathionine beta-synthase